MSRTLYGDVFMDMEESCKILNISKNTLSKRIKDGIHKCYKIGRKFYLKEKEIKEYLGISE